MFVILSVTVCKKALLTAPDSASLLVTVTPATIAVGGQAAVKVVGFKAGGTPLPDGTKIFFSADLGTIESMKQTVNGVAEALFNSSDNRSGVATITVTSGNAETTPDEITITIGSSALESLSISADPSSLPEGGGTAVIRVVAYDSNLNPLSGIPVVLNTDKGELESKGNVLTTNSNGVVEDRLTTTEPTEVTASSGEKEATLSIDVPEGEKPVISINISPEYPKVDEIVHFNASGSSDPDGEIVSFKWDFGDGHSGSGKETTHLYSHVGTYNVMLVVEDNNGNRADDSWSVTVAAKNVPTADFEYDPKNPKIGETIKFDGSFSFVPDGEIVSFKWDFGDNTGGTGQLVTHEYNQSGTYIVTLEVTDDSGNTGSHSDGITVSTGDAPTASFTIKPGEPKVDEVVSFNASGSSDDDTIESYIWDFGDGTTGSGEAATHRYQNEGTYFVKLVVTDNDGNEGSDIQTLVVEANQGPTAKIGELPSGVNVGETVNFDGSGSSDNDGTIVSFQWDFGDGTTGTGETATHQYSQGGTYNITLEVTDDSGNTGRDYKDIEITNGDEPSASFYFNPDSPVMVDETVTFYATASYDPDGDIVSWKWDFGDGSTGSGEITTHGYRTEGTYTVILVVTDNDGNSDRTNLNITANNNSNPSASFTYTPGSPNMGATVIFDASASDDPDGDIVSWKWDFGDGSTGSGEIVTHQFVSTGSYIVILTVTDDNGNKDNLSKAITVI